MVAQNYRWDFIGLSTDSKPAATNPKVADGSTYYESNTSKLFVWYNDQWYEKTATGGYELPIASASTLGGIKVGTNLSIDENGVLSAEGGGEAVVTLTSEDYNYPTDNPTSVALWLLPAGIYKRGTGATVRYNNQYGTIGSDELVIVCPSGSFGLLILELFSSNSAQNGFEYGTFHSIASNGIELNSGILCKTIDALDSTSTEAPLSANQGRILAERSNIIETTTPDTATEGVLGQLYTDTTNMHTYQCTAIDDSGDEPVYTWTQRW